MDNSNLILSFVIVAAAAIVVQAGILVGMFVMLRRSRTRVEALVLEMKGKVIPTVESLQSMIVEYRPKLDTVVSNAEQTSTIVRNQLARVDETMTDLLNRTRLHVIRADEIIGRGMDKIEQTTDTMQRAVTTPVKKVSGMMQGVTAGVDYFLNSRRRRNRQSAPGEEMFI